MVAVIHKTVLSKCNLQFKNFIRIFLVPIFYLTVVITYIIRKHNLKYFARKGMRIIPGRRKGDKPNISSGSFGSVSS